MCLGHVMALLYHHVVLFNMGFNRTNHALKFMLRLPLSVNASRLKDMFSNCSGSWGENIDYTMMSFNRGGLRTRLNYNDGSYESRISEDVII